MCTRYWHAVILLPLALLPLGCSRSAPAQNDGAPDAFLSDGSASERRWDGGGWDAAPGSPLPVTLTHMGPQYPDECVDGAIVYTAPFYWVRQVVTGPPGGIVRKFNHHVSCPEATEYEDLGGPAGWGSHYRIPDSGVLIVDYYQPQPLRCQDALLGRWKSRVEIDGVRSNEVLLTVYQSACASTADGGTAPTQCDSAKRYCVPDAGMSALW